MTPEERLLKIEHDTKVLAEIVFGICEGLRKHGIHYTYKALDADQKPAPLRQVDVKTEDLPGRFEQHVNQQVTQ